MYSSFKIALWQHLSSFFLASGFPPFMVELFIVRVCDLLSQAFAGTPRFFITPMPAVASRQLPTRVNVIRRTCLRIPSLDFHQIKSDDLSLPKAGNNRLVSVALNLKNYDPSDRIRGLLLSGSARSIQRNDTFLDERDYSRKPPLSTDKPLSWHPARPAKFLNWR